ncbi:hypothetical protein ADL28_35650 [Streptomyces violaceusniger]|uniref:MmyB-like transcription regulator ligand binding domain-containing protein n=2 Tax=Streptomyces violaceusniger group TaxID=2839105 RepID=A0ABD5JPZ2_9ACTN|nr:hypothetical protein [Streptomyces violaceusniger]KUL46324.1 hypothetical protein ADL28_35650 [Streptomyces violaceusniger]MEE4589787.1 hypothetical protein [Streptomyces sp. DSM 41602]
MAGPIPVTRARRCWYWQHLAATRRVRLLEASDDFARLWRSGDIAPPGSRIKVVRHASVGEIRLTSTSMLVSGAPETRVVVYTPCDEEGRDHVRRVRTLHDPLIGCPPHAKPLSVMRAEQAAAKETVPAAARAPEVETAPAAERAAESSAESSDPASL